MSCQVKIVLAIGILVIAKSQLHAAISTRYLCPQRWTPGDKSCSSKFNSTNYCAALIMCRFYNSHLLNTPSSSIENITERVWIYGSGVFQSWQNLSCSSNPSNGLVSNCPIRTLIATTDSEPCNATNRYYCEFKRQPVALGLQSGVISKQQLSSSSFYVSVNEPIGYESQFARLGNSFTVGTVIQGGWCSKTASHGEYIQVDFGKVVLLTRIATQGVRGRHCDYWTTSFNMKFKTGFGTWISYSQKLSGNKESSNTVLSHLSKPVIAKSFRIYPISFASSCRKATGRFCLRLEAYGIDFRRNPSKRIKQSLVNIEQQIYEDTIMSNLLKTKSQWPKGSYALPRPKNGCSITSGSIWKFGYRLYDSKFTSSNQSHLRNTLSQLFFVEEFCSRSVSIERSEVTFPRGQYCVYKTGSSCPTGLKLGYTKFFQDKATAKKSWSHTKGMSPKSSTNFDTSNVDCCYTEFSTCCANDSGIDEIELPLEKPFILLPTTSSCQNVTNTTSKMEYFDFNVGSMYTGIISPSSGTHPYVRSFINKGEMIMRYHICYYEPTVKNIGRLGLRAAMQINEVNAYYPLGIELGLFRDDNIVTFGEYSALMINITINTNCTVFATALNFSLSNGFSVYKGAIYPFVPCGKSVNLTVTFETTLASGTRVITTRELTMVSKTNILVFISNHTSLQLPTIASEINSLQSQMNYVNNTFAREVRIIKCFYKTVADFRYKLRNYGNKEESDPNRIHGIIAVDTVQIDDIMNSYAILNEIPLIIGRTTYQETIKSNNVSLQFALSGNSHIYRALSELEELNITEIVIVRSANLQIPASFVHHMLKSGIIIRKDIIIAGNGSEEMTRKALSVLQSQIVDIYFMIDGAMATNFFIGAVKARISPMDGYNWISGSQDGVYERGIGAKDCYELKPISCGKAFQGSMMFRSFDPAQYASSYVDGGAIRFDDLSSKADLMLRKDMILDGITVFVKTIKLLALMNSSITTNMILNFAATSDLDRLSGRLFSPSITVSSDSPMNVKKCRKGWTGLNCSFPICDIHKCITGQGTCVGHEICECFKGFFGRSCSGLCSCQNDGVCKAGALGDGTCTQCNWLYDGLYCEKATVLQALIAACSGSLIVGIIITCYILKACRPRQASIKIGEHDESRWIVDWDSFADMEEIDMKESAVARHLSKKIRYTSYYKGKFNDECVFVKALKRKPVKLSVDARVEIRKAAEVDHVNIEQVKAVCLGPPFVAIVTELVSMGSLYDALHNENVDLPLEIKYSFMEDVSTGMAYLHDEYSMTHGRLKSTNCLLHKGWRVKITDFGLASLRRNVGGGFGNYAVPTVNNGYANLDQQIQSAMPTDYNSLLWTAPEYLGPGIKNIEQIGNVNYEGDVYSFGILVAEILTRIPPYGEMKVMSPQNVIEVIARLREPMFDLEAITPDGRSKARQDMLSKQVKTFRPRVSEDKLPNEEPGRSMIKVLMESAWSDDPANRPPFSHITTVLRIISPLKGDQMFKRAFFLEKETELLEKYIAHDTRMIQREQEKVRDLFNRLLPHEISTQFRADEYIEARHIENVNVVAFQIADFQELISQCNPDQLFGLLDYLMKMFHAVATHFGLNVTELDLLSDISVVVLEDKEDEACADKALCYCLAIMKSMKNVAIRENPQLKLRVRAAIHNGPVMAGFRYELDRNPRFRIFGSSMTTIVDLLQVSRPNCLLVTQLFAKMVETNDDIKLIEGFQQELATGELHRTFWVVSKLNHIL